MEQVLYSLPDGWKKVCVDDICTKITDGAHKTPKYTDDGVPFLSVKDVNKGLIDFSNTRFVSQETHDDLYKRCNPERNDILYTKVGSTGVAKVVDTDREFSLFVSVALLKPKSELIDSKYFEYALNSPESYTQAQSLTRGVANRNLVLKDIKSITFNLAPIKEQKRIVEKLDALLTRIDTAIEHLQESVILADALSQNGLDVYFAELTKTNPELPLLKLVDFISGYAFKSGDFTSESGVKPIKITNVGVTEFSENAEEFLPTSYEIEYQRFSAKVHDIVIALTRPIINGGLKVCRVPESYSGALVNQRVAAITSHNKHLLDFIYLYLQSSRTKNYVLEKSKSLNQPNLSITDLKNLTLPLPDNDEGIAKAVTDCNALISKARKSKAEISEKIKMIQQLKASILDSAFKGEL